MPYVYSTATADNIFPLYRPPVVEGAPSVIEKEVFIHGGANVANKVLVTPRGAVTKITEEEKAILLKSPSFVDGMKAGFFTIEDKEAGSIDAVADALTPRDGSAPITPQDIELEGKKAPTIGKRR